MEWFSGEHLTIIPPSKPYPPEVGFISTITLRSQSEHFPFIVIVDFSGLASNIFLNSSIIDSHLPQLLTIQFKFFSCLIFLVFASYPIRFFFPCRICAQDNAWYKKIADDQTLNAGRHCLY